jgi:predicted Rossmann fold flavoprotein
MTPESSLWPAVVVGAGAAGITAGIFAARGGVRVLVLETRKVPGAKIRVSGGGRCNVLPQAVELSDFHTAGSDKTMRNVLFSWPLEQVRAFFEDELHVALKAEPTGKLFPRSDDAREVVAALLGELERSGASLRAPFKVARIDRIESEGGACFRIESDLGESLSCERLVLATGGLSLPKTGSDGLGLELAVALGHSLVPTYPALVPLTSSDPAWGELAGVSVHVRLAATRAGKLLEQREGDLLFTHRGFSGPVVLDLSRHLSSPDGSACELRVHWTPRDVPDWDGALREVGRGTLGARLRDALPRRLADRLLHIAGLAPEVRLADLRREDRARLVGLLSSFPLPVAGDEGYAKAEVTGGGLPLSEFVTKTLESRIVGGLYCCGEMLDATGRIGGFNFLWAWVSGRKVGRALAEACAGRSASAAP